MAHIIISDEINAGILKDSSWASPNVFICLKIDCISYIEEHVIR